MPKYLVRHSGCVCECSGLRLTFGLVDGVPQTAPPNVMSFIQSVEGLNRTKKVTDLRIREDFFPSFGLKLEHRFFLGLEAVGHWTAMETLALLVLRT